MPVFAILPVKGFEQAKHRLARELSPRPRQALVEAMYADVLAALRQSRHVGRLLVVSGDRGAQQIATGYGAIVIEDDQQGHNSAAGRGIAYALREGAERVLLVPGDCPLLDPAELDGLLAQSAGQRHVLIVPDRHGTGTNALVLSPPDALAPSFGPGSCERHAAAAASRGITPEVVPVPTLALDIDTPEDLTALAEELIRTDGPAPRTRSLLSRLSRGGGQ